ncbi:MAG: LysR family transcriptional regulator [Proteobacteria bacterium]|nr:LysR family transcriptional regulator [Pseudomonadota bacterium]
MNLRQVEAFRALMETNSVTKAGKLLFITQPAVSRLIADFEATVGLSLFERRKGRLYPTEEGKLLYKEVEKAFVGLKQITQTAQSIKSLECGSLRIVAIPGMVTSFLPSVVASFAKKYPGINIFLYARANKNFLEWAETSFYDIAILDLIGETPEAKIVTAYSVEYGCIMSSNHPLRKKKTIKLTDFEGELFVSYPSDTRIRFEIDRQFEKAGVKRQLKFETRPTEAINNLVQAGVGISVVPAFSNDIKTNPQLVYRKCDIDLTVDLALVVPKQIKISLAAQHFIEIFKENAAKTFSLTAKV